MAEPQFRSLGPQLYVETPSPTLNVSLYDEETVMQEPSKLLMSIN